MRIKKYIPYALFFAFVLLSNAQTFAQCAMCKTSVESDLKTGGSIGTGLNTGILYLMAIPYIILMVGGYFFFKKPIDAKIKAWKNKRFSSKQLN
jgi:high-affinity nickel permease